MPVAHLVAGLHNIQSKLDFKEYNQGSNYVCSVSETSPEAQELTKINDFLMSRDCDDK